MEHVVHYDAARSAEVFIHRAGRTARARAAGLSLSIVAPRDDANHRQTCSVLGLHDGMQAFPLDMRMVERARERVGMAVRVRERGGGEGRGVGGVGRGMKQGELVGWRDRKTSHGLIDVGQGLVRSGRGDKSVLCQMR